MAEPGPEIELWPRVSGAAPEPAPPHRRTPLVASPLIAQADAARRPIPGLAAAAIAAVLPAASVLAGVAAAGALQPKTPLAVAALVSVVALGPLLVAAWLLMSVIEGRPAATTRARLGAALGFGVLLAGVGLGLALALPALGQGTSLKAAGLAIPGFAAAFLVMLFQTVGEEVFFRGWLLPILTSRWGAWVGLAASSLLFAAPHFIGSPLSPLAVLNDTLAGTVFGLLALRTGGLAAPIAAHFTWNFAEAHLLGAYPNPGIDPLGSILDLEFFGPGWLTGGEAALNGALPATVALGLMAVSAYLWAPRPR